MITFAFEYRYRVLLAQFSRIHVSEDISELDRAVIEIVAWGGPVHGLLLDYTSIEAVAVSETFIVQRAHLPLISPEIERVMVAPNPELYRLARTYATLQCELGIKQPRVALSLSEAYELLDLEQPNFRPIGD